ncbi:MAG: 3-deoxy-8-phosphooctulonate synthase [Gammaproteobacteria bacterium]|nr:3-deoxy-8-phosphooctulonate synthase [Pseudomonadota bacterium]MCH9663725.1 3-deoxy-8-phosphooctulonate synthase [Gammaproteobacteria bacterium]
MKIFSDWEIGNDQPFFLIAGPCAIESEELARETAGFLRETCEKLNIPLIYKSSFDKANRSSVSGRRGVGIEKGLQILEMVKKEFSLPVLTDVHEDTPVDEVASVVDVLQTPAFLCRQTNFIQRVARTLKPINIKKGQFLAPADMRLVIEKAEAVGNRQIMVCERGACFGYNNLVSDMRSLMIMREFGYPVVFDATHSVQLPGAMDGRSGGQRQYVPALSKAALAVGVAGLFTETHPRPDEAFSDGPNAVPLARMPALLEQLRALDDLIKSFPADTLGPATEPTPAQAS